MTDFSRNADYIWEVGEQSNYSNWKQLHWSNQFLRRKKLLKTFTNPNLYLGKQEKELKLNQISLPLLPPPSLLTDLISFPQAGNPASWRLIWRDAAQFAIEKVSREEESKNHSV